MTKIAKLISIVKPSFGATGKDDRYGGKITLNILRDFYFRRIHIRINAQVSITETFVLPAGMDR